MQFVRCALPIVLALAACTGEDGSNGTRGLPGEPGPIGETGPMGAPGASGVVKALAVDAAGFLPTADGTAVFPTQCQTAAYVAGAGEVAIVQADASIRLQGVNNAELSVNIGVQKDGTLTAPGHASVAALSDLSASAGTQLMTPLVEGSSYVFGVQLTVNSTLNTTRSVCHLTAMVVREAP